MTQDSQQERALAAIGSGLLHVNASISEPLSLDEMIEALRSPKATMAAGPPRLTAALIAFMDETEDSLLARIAKGRDVTWRHLQTAAKLTLRPGDPKLDWINSRAI